MHTHTHARTCLPHCCRRTQRVCWACQSLRTRCHTSAARLDAWWAASLARHARSKCMQCMLPARLCCSRCHQLARSRRAASKRLAPAVCKLPRLRVRLPGHERQRDGRAHWRRPCDWQDARCAWLNACAPASASVHLAALFAVAAPAAAAPAALLLPFVLLCLHSNLFPPPVVLLSAPSLRLVPQARAPRALAPALTSSLTTPGLAPVATARTRARASTPLPGAGVEAPGGTLSLSPPSILLSPCVRVCTAASFSPDSAWCLALHL